MIINFISRGTRFVQLYRNRPTSILSSRRYSLVDMEISKKITTDAFTDIQYEKAIEALNGLQSNSEVLEKQRISGTRKDLTFQNINMTQSYLERTGMKLIDLDKLSVIHVAGTKGKGSTCAFVESLLREQGYKTGFFSSPHLVAARERIRINGLPIAKKEFTFYFWNVYNSLSALKENDSDMPAYFKFLTVLAFNIFFQEDVDVAIIEVGIGGEYDCTNVIRRPIVCGITSLDIDHTSILGSTIEEIAWNKAGIMKPGVPVFTVPQQPSTALTVLYERAKEKQSELMIVPPLENYGWSGKPIHLGLSGFCQFLNASLALQLSHYWLEHRGRCGRTLTRESIGQPFELSEEDISALANVVWPGRSQVVEAGRITFFLDGAHTHNSIKSCTEWYEKLLPQLSCCTQEGHSRTYKALVFNLTGNRDGEALLRLLHPCKFDVVIFTTNLVSTEMSAASDQRNFTVSEVSQIARCQTLQKIWMKLDQEALETSAETDGGPDSSDGTSDSSFASNVSHHSNVNLEEVMTHMTSSESTKGRGDNAFSKPSVCVTFPCIKDTLEWLSSYGTDKFKDDNQGLTSAAFATTEDVQMQVLVTGSLHLVGGFLAFIDPSLSLPNKGSLSSHGSLVDYVRRKYIHLSTPAAP